MAYTNITSRRNYSDPEEAFVARTEQDGECLTWTGSLDRGGYGRLNFGGKRVSSHRYAWERENGPIPEGLVVDHRCWNRACVNVDHLRLATPSQNASSISGPKSNSSSGHRCIQAVDGGWRTRVRRDGRTHGSRHAVLADAIAERDMLLAMLFGEFAGKG